MTDHQTTIFRALLGRTKAAPLAIADAVRLTGLTERGVRRVVKSLTSKGHVIISPPAGGYYIADPKSPEVQVYIRRSRARVYAEMKMLKIIDGQASLAWFQEKQVALFGSDEK